jgi:trk system potassium uptake protein
VYDSLKRRRAAAILAAVLLVIGLVSVDGSSSLLLLAALYETVVLLMLLARGPIFADLMESFLARPALLILSTFAGMAGMGALLLSFPAASRGAPLAFIDALFTATSASCITGLTVLDTASTFTDFGQMVILVLIQLGGLGIMVLSTFATVLLGGRLALRSEQALEEVLDLASPGSAYKLTRFIVLSTLAIEAVGAGLLAWAFHGRGMEWGQALWAGAFHSVASFCHAGFSLWPDSLISFADDGLVLGVHMTLMLIGSLGFSVMAALWLRMRGARQRFSLQTRVVLWMTLLLIVLGTVFYALLEWNATLQGLPAGWKWLHALFQSVSLRSGGFNSVDYTTIEPATVTMMMMWMFIGAAPGSTGGGIKVTTLAVMLAAIPALLRNQPRATLMRRAIPLEIVYRAATIVTVAGVGIALSMILLLATHRMRFDWMAFEVISALGTVGMSIGATPHLSALGKWVMILLMFVGRVGPTSLALAVGASRTSQVRFPEGRLMVG